MTENNPPQRRQERDELLDALLDALDERRAARAAAERRVASPPLAPPKPAETLPPAAPPPPARPAEAPPQKAKSSPSKPAGPGQPGWTIPPRLPTIGMDRALGRMLLLVLALTALLNIPVTRYGVSLARILPDSAALVIRDGLILKGAGPEIYRLEDNKLRWISSMSAFEHLGLQWEDVHVVDDPFLTKFEKGAPIHVLLKCGASPHIYRLEGERKRWIKDIPTFEAEGHVWEDVRIVTCEELRAIPDGPPIPEDAGPPPQP
jgi:hypothetical protein